MKHLFLSLFLSFAVLATEIQVVLTNPVETDLEVAGTFDTQKTWIEMIQKAKQTLDIEQFYVSDEKGEALEPVLNEIRTAAKRGIKVRLLADKKFFVTYPETIKELGSKQNIEARVIDYDKISGGVQHAKFFIVDRKDTYLGSANFDWRALSHIHEIGLRVLDVKLGKQLTAVFELDWNKAIEAKVTNTVSDSITENEPAGNLELVGSPSSMLPNDVPHSIGKLLNLIEKAKSSIQIQVYEYSTKLFGNTTESWHVLEDALKKAAARGVKIKFMMDATQYAKNKKDLDVLSKVTNIETRIIKIPAFSGGTIQFARLIHSKYMIVDEKTFWVGTDNWSKNYFYNSRGVGFIGSDTQTTSTLMQVYDRLWASPYATKL